MSNYKNFNRHEVYTSEMRDLQRKIMRKIDETAFETGKSIMNPLNNMMYGLYDGYLYNNLLQEAEAFGLDQDSINGIKGLIKAIEIHIALSGEHNIKNKL